MSSPDVVEIDWNSVHESAYIKFYDPENSTDHANQEGCESDFINQTFEITANRGIDSGKLTSIYIGLYNATIARRGAIKERLRREIADRIALWRILSVLPQNPQSDVCERRELMPFLRACEETLEDLHVPPTPES